MHFEIKKLSCIQFDLHFTMPNEIELKSQKIAQTSVPNETLNHSNTVIILYKTNFQTSEVDFGCAQPVCLPFEQSI